MNDILGRKKKQQGPYIFLLTSIMSYLQKAPNIPKTEPISFVCEENQVVGFAVSDYFMSIKKHFENHLNNHLFGSITFASKKTLISFSGPIPCCLRWGSSSIPENF